MNINCLGCYWVNDDGTCRQDRLELCEKNNAYKGWRTIKTKGGFGDILEAYQWGQANHPGEFRVGVRGNSYEVLWPSNPKKSK